MPKRAKVGRKTGKDRIRMVYIGFRRAFWRSLPFSIQRHIIYLLRRTEFSDTLTVRRFAEFVRSRLYDELIVSPNGEAWFRDSDGAEFFVPFQQTDWIGRGVSQIEPLESDLLARNLTSGTMLDIGANVGVHSIRVAKRLPEVSIFAFEPVTANHALLVKNIARNGLSARVFAVHTAVGATNGTVTIPSCLGTGNWVGGHISGVRNEEIPLQTIDSFLKEKNINDVTIVKCDVEGYEFHVLKGMTGCLQKARPRLLIEVDEGWCARLGNQALDVFYLMGQYEYQYMRLMRGIGLKKALASVSESLSSTNNFWFFPEEKGPGRVEEPE